MSMSDRDGFIWFDGKLVPWREANVHVLTHTLHYGMGVFEGVRAYQTPEGTGIFRLEDHTKRLINSAKILGMKIPYSQKEIEDAQKLVVEKNNLKSGYIRPMCFYGSEGMGLRADNLKEHLYKISRVGLKDAFVDDYGDQSALLTKYNITEEYLINKMLKLIKND